MDSELRARKVSITDATHQDPAYINEYTARLADRIEQDQLKQNESSYAWIKQHGGKNARIYTLSQISNLSGTVQRVTATDQDPEMTQLLEQLKTGSTSSQGGYNPYGGADLTFESIAPDMLVTQLQPGQTTSWHSGQPYPIFVPYTFLEKLSGQSSAHLSPAQQNVLYRKLISQYTGKEMNYCYRNQQATTILEAVLQYNQNLIKTNDKQHKPVSTAPCQSFDAKTLKSIGLNSDGTFVDDSSQVAKPLFPSRKTDPASTSLLTLKIVGFVSAPSAFDTDLLGSLLNAQYNWQIPLPGFIPSDVVSQDPYLSGGLYGKAAYSQEQYFVDFHTRNEQKAFIAKSCSGSGCNKSNAALITPFGNINVTLEDIINSLAGIIFIGTIVAAILAIAIMLLVVSRVIADSRKEIAVFRAVGAKKRDIAQIYYTYGFSIFVSSTVFAICLATAAALVLTNLFSTPLSAMLVTATGAYQTSVHATLLGLSPAWLVAITLLLFVSMVIGVSLPLSLSLKKRLINSLREE